MPLGIIVYGVSVTPMNKILRPRQIKAPENIVFAKKLIIFAKIPIFGSEYVKIKLPQKEA